MSSDPVWALLAGVAVTVVSAPRARTSGPPVDVIAVGVEGAIDRVAVGPLFSEYVGADNVSPVSEKLLMTA